MTVTLVYHVPVYVDVDTRTGRVTSVTADDTGAEFHHVLEGGERGLTKAQRIAEEVEWPSWEVGL